VSGPELESVRLDVWLWAARFFKTRSLAKAAVEGGKIEVAGQSVKPSRAIRTGERIRVTRGEERIELMVYGLSEVRGGAPAAQQLYRETDESRAAREAARAARRHAAAGYSKPATRPDKHAREALRKLKEES